MGFLGLTLRGVPPMPTWITYVQIASCVLCLGVIVASAYNMNSLNGWGTYLTGYAGPLGYMIFDCVWTWITMGAMLAIPRYAPHLYYRLAFAVSLFLLAIFWLSAWAWAASYAGSFYSYYQTWDFGTGRSSELDGYGASLAAAAALGAFNWVLICVTLVFFVLGCNNSQKETAPPNPFGNELGTKQNEPTTTTTPAQ